MMPKKYVMKAETGIFESKVGALEPVGGHETDPFKAQDKKEQPDETIDISPAGMVKIGILLINLLNALRASNDFMVRLAFHAQKKKHGGAGYVDQMINIEVLDQMIKANEDVLGLIVIKE